LFQHLDHLLVLALHSNSHRCSTCVVSFLEISAVREQHGDAILVSEPSGPVEWGVAVIVSGVNVCARLDELRDDWRPTSVGGPVQ
jgi:hypothetical protein